MPTTTYFQMEPVTDDKIKIMADLWNRVGQLTLEHGHEDHLPLRVLGRDPHPRAARPVLRATPTRSTSSSSATPRSTRSPASTRSQLFRDYQDRCTGFHFKDTHNVDEHEAYRTPPDPELMAPEVTRWFYEMGPRAAWSTSRR